MAHRPGTPQAPGMARLRPAGRPGRVAAGPGRGPGVPQRQHRPRPEPASWSASRTSRSRARTSTVRAIVDFPRFCTHVLGWRAGDLVGSKDGGPIPDGPRSKVLTDYNETLRPTYAVPTPEPVPEGKSPWLMLVKVLPAGTDLDDVAETDTTTAGRPAPRPASSGSCARPRCRSACSPAARTSGWSTPRAARPRAT